MLNTHHIGLLGLIVLCLISFSKGYVSGVAQTEYTATHKPIIQVNKLSSFRTQLPYMYYYLPFCAPPKRDLHPAYENIGEVLSGDKIEDSLYEVTPLQDISCKAINRLSIVGNTDKCSTYSQRDIKKFIQFINNKYFVNWILDDMPAARVLNYPPSLIYNVGFPLGPPSNTIESRLKINNHVDIKIKYNTHGTKNQGGVYIIGFEVMPSSRAYNYAEWTEEQGRLGLCPDYDDEQIIDANANQTHVIWTYSVLWEPTDTPWAKRWDLYFYNSGANIHWISIVTAVTTVLFVTGAAAMIFVRILRVETRKDFSLSSFSSLSDDGDEEEDKNGGWKALHGDVFRPPKRPMALATLIGSGIQLFGTAVVVLLLSLFGLLSPAQRGMLITIMLVVFVAMGGFAGYFSTRSYMIFRGNYFVKNAITTALAFPGIMFVIYFILNMFQRNYHSTGAVPASVLLTLLIMLVISAALAFVGSFIATRRNVPHDHLCNNDLMREIPKQAWYKGPLVSILVSGLPPFGVIFIENFFVLLSLWGYPFYTIFGFIAIIFVLLLVACAAVAIVMCYYQLRAGDYNWWWRSFLNGGASALYMFLYAIFYFATNLQLTTFVSCLIYFGYSLIIALAYFVMTGTVGFFACLFFVRKIYSSIQQPTGFVELK